MRGLLVRVGADQTDAGGQWNGPVDAETGEFAYVPIPEGRPVRPGLETGYRDAAEAVERLGCVLPEHFRLTNAHLDPDFAYLTYGDRGERAKQIRSKLGQGDLIVFYASLRDVRSSNLAYALVGLYRVARILPAADIPEGDRCTNAHTRRDQIGSDDIVVRSDPGGSGRLLRCIRFAEYRDRAYRIRRDVLEDWGGVSVRDGYVQRSARLPELADPSRFLDWFANQRPELVARNN